MIADVLKIDSVALYGSRARRDADRISDLDLLIVDSSPAVLSYADRILHSLGFSCAAYTWARLAYMSENGSLFLQHLKNESIILKDEDSRLERLLRSFEPKCDYAQDIEATRRVISLTERVACTKASIGWALDVIAVGVRNIGILELANRGLYVFSLSAIYDELVHVGLLTRSDVQTLLPLRLFKSQYRSQSYHLMPGLAALNHIQRTISKRFRIDFNNHVLSRDALLSDFLARSEQHENKYCRFRLIEGAAVTFLDNATDLPASALRRFVRLIQNQNQYGLFYHDLSIPLRTAAVDVMTNRSAGGSLRVVRANCGAAGRIWRRDGAGEEMGNKRIEEGPGRRWERP